MSEQIKVIQYGIGPIGSIITRFISEKTKLKIIGAVDKDENKQGKDLGELAGMDKALGVKVVKDLTHLTKDNQAEIAVLTTTSGLLDIKPQVLELVGRGMNVVSTCEELTYPWITNPKIASEIDEAAKRNNVTVLSTGVNPGFLMDFLPLTISSVCRQIRNIKVERIQNALQRRLPFQKKIGSGLTKAEFEKKVSAKEIRHVGLTESVHMIAARMGWELDETKDIIIPVVSNDIIRSEYFNINPGDIIGVQQTGLGIRNGVELIKLVFKASLGELSPRDRIIIDGIPSIDMTIGGGVNGDIATCAITVNAIPTVVRAKAGLRTMADIEPVSYFS